jgi:hypothetical protein
MSEMSARARRLALAFGSLARNGLIGRRGAPCPPGGVARTPNGVRPLAGAGWAALLGLGRTNGIAGRAGDGARGGIPPGARGGGAFAAGCASTRPNSAAAVAAPRFGAAVSAPPGRGGGKTGGCGSARWGCGRAAAAGMGAPTAGGDWLVAPNGADGACDGGANLDGGAAAGAACGGGGWRGAAGCAYGLAVDPVEYPPARAA